jgi:hypothetical protein
MYKNIILKLYCPSFVSLKRVLRGAEGRGCGCLFLAVPVPREIWYPSINVVFVRARTTFVASIKILFDLILLSSQKENNYLYI